MNIELLFEYVKHFLLSCVDFLSQPHGIVILGVVITLVIVTFFGDMRA